MLFERNTDVRGWKLHLRDPWSISNNGSFTKSVKMESWILRRREILLCGTCVSRGLKR